MTSNFLSFLLNSSLNSFNPCSSSLEIPGSDRTNLSSASALNILLPPSPFIIQSSSPAQRHICIHSWLHRIAYVIDTAVEYNFSLFPRHEGDTYSPSEY